MKQQLSNRKLYELAKRGELKGMSLKVSPPKNGETTGTAKLVEPTQKVN